MYDQFRFFRVDSQPKYLQATFQLRYAVYCREKKFLAESDYPNRLEIDAYDKHALHFAAIDNENLVKGTVRLVYPTAEQGFPLSEHCTLDEPLPPATGEISRIAISKRYRRQFTPTERRERAGKGINGDAFGLTVMTLMLTDDERTRVNRIRLTIILGLYKAIFQESKRFGIKNWLAAMEPSLARLLLRRHIAFRQIGPEVDYYGTVAPYLLNVEDLEHDLAEKNPKFYAELTNPAP